MSDNSMGTSITVLLPAGRLPLNIMKTAQELAENHSFDIYLSLQQNLRLINVPEAVVKDVKEKLAKLGAEFKAPGKFPLPRICVGKPHCNLGVVNTEQLSKKILQQFRGRKHTKARFKIAIAGCTIGCSWPKNSDIAIMATRRGYTVFTGGKGGLIPRDGRRIKVKITEDEVLETIAVLVDFHDKKTKTKKRIFQLLNDPEFPFAEV